MVVIVGVGFGDTGHININAAYLSFTGRWQWYEDGILEMKEMKAKEFKLFRNDAGQINVYPHQWESMRVANWYEKVK